MSDRPLELDDIQGDILGGFNTNIQLLLGLSAPTTDVSTRAGAWVSGLAPELTTVAEMRIQRGPMKSAEATPLTWLSVAIGRDLLRAVAPDLVIRDAAFEGGMTRRGASVLGDATDPAQWSAGAPGAPIDVLLKIAGNDEAAVLARGEALVSSAQTQGFCVSYREVGRRIEDLEHFGFRDGVSQPNVSGDDLEPGVGAGHFIFGYPRRTGTAPYTSAVDPRNLTDNGSLLVFRRLQQHVDVFRAFCRSEAARLQPVWPGLGEHHLQALIVGRWPKGALATPHVTEDPGRPPDDNAFDFADDHQGLNCPFGAHIRKVNPREGPADVAEVPRMLRRGVPFGPLFDVAPDEVRGLLFLAFQTSIVRQFEMITSRWMNSRQTPAPGHDLLVGRPFGPRIQTISGPNGPVEIRADVEWITPTGGGYFFAPGRKALAKLADPAARPGLWTSALLFERAKSGLRNLLA